MKRIGFILAALAIIMCGCGKEAHPEPTGLELGFYQADTPDGSLFLEIVAENTCKLYFNGENPHVWNCTIEDDTIKFIGKADVTCRREGTAFYGQKISYYFSSNEPGRITSRTSFTINGDTGSRKFGMVRCDFRKP